VLVAAFSHLASVVVEEISVGDGMVAVAGRPAARPAAHLSIPTSANSLLRLL
jgi:hypothetical protein